MSDSIGFKKLRETATTVLQGDYPVVVDKVTYKRTQKNNEPMWVITLKVTAGPYTGRTVGLNLVLSAEHQFMVKRFFNFMNVLGADDKFFDAEPTPDAVSLQIQGRHAIATFEEGKEFRGEKREEVAALKAATGGTVTVSVGMPQASSLPAAAPVVVTAPATEGIAPPEDPF